MATCNDGQFHGREYLLYQLTNTDEKKLKSQLGHQAHTAINCHSMHSIITTTETRSIKEYFYDNASTVRVIVFLKNRTSMVLRHPGLPQ